ncbi:aldehyde dehydrogenase (NAD+) [Ancylomarina subtilis]|uniref:aldehyde dehydrogenase (NAD(+)) n=1 Tax=Ancylomarina subtilis TaxID=1639035 RepID=A0A4Q7VM16_9BACT|nr:aldehyde dehydrogenase family protein [Ancylomarina subtilis]RZT97333.1 aldehyde dehydrogenase (NAD+) [Ancylomarina subtilis]
MSNFGIRESLKRLGISEVNSGVTTGTQWFECKGNITSSYSPIDDSEIAKVVNADINDYEKVLDTAQEAFKQWKKVPAPARGEVVRQIGNALREAKEDLGKLVSFEMGKIYQEGLGEVQEMIDICDFAVGLSRQLYGFTMHSERPDHKMMDQYHPLGVVGVISAFNFPVAVWAWNAMIAAVCGDVVIWKPSSKVPLCALACQNIIQKVLKDNDVPEGVFNLVVAKSSVMGDNFIEDKRVPLISVTGSTAIGKRVAEKVGARLGRTIAELGGNNAIIVAPSADLDMAIPGIVFGSVGTAGQRCTSTRRLIIHEDIYDDVKNRLLNAYAQVEKKIGNPLDPSTLVGPVIDKDAVKIYKTALAEVKKAGGQVVFGDKVLKGNYVLPSFCEVENHWQIVQDESFVPVLYIMKYNTLDQAIAMHNDVPQGLSSSIFTMNMREAQTFLSTVGSDCGIANVNIGTSGAEIGGAFGGEKETGGGRESGSDSWKTYMRRQTNTINYGTDLPLAQGIKFDL